MKDSAGEKGGDYIGNYMGPGQTDPLVLSSLIRVHFVCFHDKISLVAFIADIRDHIWCGLILAHP